MPVFTPTPKQLGAATVATNNFIIELHKPLTSYTSKTIGWFYHRPYDFGVGSCALVGGGATLVGRGLGPVIDAHDHVIRVNRLPTNSSHYRDVGRRTSVWFAKMCRLKPFHSGPKAALRLLVMNSKLKTGDADDGPSGYCPLDGPAARCPFGAFVARGGFKDPKDNKCITMGSRVLSGRQSASFPVGLVDEPVWDAALAMRHGREASTGLHAILAFAPRCRGGLHLYGFSGNGTNDGHHIGHALSIEHKLLGELAQRSGGRIEIVT